MELHLDQHAGRAVGSHIRLEGRVLGVPLALEEVVTEHAPPTRKVWETIGVPRLLVIGPYRMGFMLAPGPVEPQDTDLATLTLTVFIDYALPARGLSRLIGPLVGHWYARWCTQRMVADAEAAFRPASPSGAV
jgi:hypothetical protein